MLSTASWYSINAFKTTSQNIKRVAQYLINKKSGDGAGEKTRWLKSLSATNEDLSLVSNTHVEQPSVIRAPGTFYHSFLVSIGKGTRVNTPPHRHTAVHISKSRNKYFYLKRAKTHIKIFFVILKGIYHLQLSRWPHMYRF